MADKDAKSELGSHADAVTNASRRLARILSDAGALPDEEIAALQRKFPDEYLGDVLVREKVLLKTYLEGLLIRALHIPWIVAEGCTVPPHVADLLSESFCREHRVMPIGWVREVMTLACTNPLAEEVFAEVRYATGLSVRLVLCSEEALDGLIDRVFAKDETEEEVEAEAAGASSAGDAGQVQSEESWGGVPDPSSGGIAPDVGAAESKAQGTENREQGTKNSEPETSN